MDRNIISIIGSLESQARHNARVKDWAKRNARIHSSLSKPPMGNGPLLVVIFVLALACLLTIAVSKGY